MEDDFIWFKEHYDELFQEYGHKFFAIKNKTILGVYDSVRQALDNTKEMPGTFIVQECNGDESGYTCYISSMNFV